MNIAKNNSGFSALEMTLVLCILAIVASCVTINYSSYIKRLGFVTLEKQYQTFHMNYKSTQDEAAFHQDRPICIRSLDLTNYFSVYITTCPANQLCIQDVLSSNTQCAQEPLASSHQLTVTTDLCHSLFAAWTGIDKSALGANQTDSSSKKWIVFVDPNHSQRCVFAESTSRAYFTYNFTSGLLVPPTQQATSFP